MPEAPSADTPTAAEVRERVAQARDAVRARLPEVELRAPARWWQVTVQDQDGSSSLILLQQPLLL